MTVLKPSKEIDFLKLGNNKKTLKNDLKKLSYR
jgi:hypothetical protein